MVIVKKVAANAIANEAADLTNTIAMGEVHKVDIHHIVNMSPEKATDYVLQEYDKGGSAGLDKGEWKQFFMSVTKQLNNPNLMLTDAEFDKMWDQLEHDDNVITRDELINHMGGLQDEAAKTIAKETAAAGTVPPIMHGEASPTMDIHKIVNMTPEQAANEALKMFDTDGDNIEGLTKEQFRPF